MIRGQNHDESIVNHLTDRHLPQRAGTRIDRHGNPTDWSLKMVYQVTYNAIYGNLIMRRYAKRERMVQWLRQIGRPDLIRTIMKVRV